MDISDPEYSASWSTQGQSVADKADESTTRKLAERTQLARSETSAQSIEESVTRLSWNLIESFKAHESYVRAVAFSPDGTKIACGSDDGTVSVWNSAGAALGVLRGHNYKTFTVAFSPDGKLLAFGSDAGTVRVWDYVTGAVRDESRGRSGWIWCIVFSPDGQSLASGSYSYSGTVELLDLATWSVRWTTRHEDRVTALAFSPDGKRVTSISDDKTIKLWNSRTGAALGTFTGHDGKASAVIFSPDGKQIASGSSNWKVRFWDSATGAACGRLGDYIGYPVAFTFSPDGKKLASASKKLVKLWDVATGKRLGEFTTNETHDITLRSRMGEVGALVFTPDEKLMALTVHASTIRLWELDPTV